MPSPRAHFDVTAGPNEGDTVRLDMGSCRLIGRHLSEHETALMDRDGNRILDRGASELFAEHLIARKGDQKKTKAPTTRVSDARPARGTRRIEPEEKAPAFERGADVIFADDAISRAHAMLFYGATGVGLIDLASTNGTFVNQERIASTIVAEGDTISLGDSEMVISLKKA